MPETVQTAATKNGKASDDTLLGALLAIQADPPILQQDATNPHFRSRFVSLPEVMRKTLPKLTAHKLVWTTLPGHVEGVGPTLAYRLAHAVTGEVIEGVMPLMLVKQDAQSLGSAITYARRYAILAVLGLVADDDDDGHRATQAAHRAPANATSTSADITITGITPDQYTRIVGLFREAGSDTEAFHAQLDTVGAPENEQASSRVSLLSREQATTLIELLDPLNGDTPL